MKKVITIAFLALLCSCMPTTQSNGPTSTDSITADDYEKQEAQKMNNTIFAQMADSIFKLHPGDIKNQIIQEDIAKDLKKYAMQFKGKHMPLIEELPFKCKGVVEEGNHYIAGFMYKRDADKNVLGLELQVAITQSREDAAKLVEGDTYYLKGIMAGFPYQSVYPYALEPLYTNDRPLLSLGAIKLDNAEIIKK
ncbi:MAG: hypothetical protein J5629_10395 [Muribaculaceae bacterium]|nr:hypothetical protein [Muribaculaceae bacterium]